MIHTARRLADRIADDETLVGLIVKMPSPALIELAGHTGFDLVVIDTEHGTAGTAELEHHLRAADSGAIPALVRVGANDPLLIMRALDAGAAGVIVPHVSSAEEAQHAVWAAHYPPSGHRGLAVSTRAGRHGTSPLRQHLADADTDTVVVAQIEDRDSITQSARIAATRRLNAVWIGPGDLSLSLGRPGQLDHPEVIAAVDQITADVLEAADCALCVLVETPEEAAGWRARGAGILLYNSAALVRDVLRQAVSAARPDSLQVPG